MVHMSKGIWALGIPVVFSLMTVLKHSVLLLAVLIISHFIILRFVPVFNGHENLWMFIFVAVSTIPLNAYALIFLNELGFLFDLTYILKALLCVIYYAALFCIEEIIMGVITRVIWRKQNKPVL